MNVTKLSLLIAGCVLSQGTWATNGEKGSVENVKNKGYLLTEWDAAHDSSFIPYKENYLLLLSNSSSPNHAPTSPNPSNQVPFSYPLKNDEVKFQLSAKSSALCFGQNNSVWLAYTQQSYWQVFDTAHSRPFRESNYEPEVIFSLRYAAEDSLLKFANLGLVHQSNGQSLPRSRSWNRVYLQAGFEKNWGEHTLIVEPRIWSRFGKNGANDDNPDITQYLGYGEVNLRYISPSQWNASALVKARSLQLGINIRTFNHIQFYAQYFTGYGESLIDYNQKHNSIGFGISLPMDFLENKPSSNAAHSGVGNVGQ